MSPDSPSMAAKPTMSLQSPAAPLVVVAIAALSLWLRSGFPIYAIGGASIDDALFVRLAASLRRAHWLGAYNEVTLAKGMFFPLFIAAAATLHIPLMIAEQLVYLAVAGGFGFMSYRLSRSRWLGVVLFAVLALNPVVWTLGFARVVREGLYISLSLGVAAAAAALCLHVFTASPGRRRIVFAAGTGALFAAFWLTREEGVWMVPPLMVIALFAALCIAVDRARPGEAKRRAARAATTAAASLGVAVLLVTAVAGLNWAVYGVFTDVEFRAHGFLSAYGALTRVKQDAPQPFVPVPRAVREKVYAVSAAAAELRSLDGKLGEGWRRNGCAQQAAESCNDIRGGWFVWALRDAAAAAGHYRTGGEAETFYERMAREVDLACTAGRLDCAPPRVSLRPPFQLQQAKDAAAMSPRMVALLLRFGKGEIISRASDGTPAQLALFRDLVGPVEPSDDTAAITDVSGWIAGAQGPPAIAVTDSAGNPHGRVDLTPAPDVDRALDGRGLFAHRFSISPQCPAPACNVVITTGDGAVRQFPLSALNRELPTDAAYVLNIEYLGHAADVAAPPDQHGLEPVQRIARTIADIYALAMPVLFATGSLGLVIALWAFRREPALLFLAGLAVAAGAAIAARVALLSYIEVTTFSAFNTPYLSPATPFAIVVVVLGNWLGARALITTVSRRG